MASLVKNKNNYGLIWTDSSRAPSQVRESLKTDVLKKAKRKKAALENSYWEGDHDPWRAKWYEKSNGADVYLLPDAIESFIEYKTNLKGQGGWNPTTAHNEAATLRLFGRLVGDTPVERLDKEDLKSFYYREGVNSDHTRNSLYISVRAFLNWAVKEGIIKDKPKFKPKKPQQKIPKFIELEKIETLIGCCRRDWVRLGWLVLAGTGMRPVELAHIKKKYVNPSGILIGGDFTTKVRAERNVPLLFEAGAAVGKLMQSGGDSPYLLGRNPKYTKRKLSRTFTACWKECFPEAPKRTLYDIKSTFCVRFLSDNTNGSGEGMGLMELKQILGHSSVQTTERYMTGVQFGTRLEGKIETELLP